MFYDDLPMATMTSAREQLEEILAHRIMLLDGAMGSLINAQKPTEQDYRGERFADHAVDLKNAMDVLCLSQPEMIAGIHRRYFEAGADIVETNTFNANTISLEEFQLADCVYEINLRGAQLAKAEAARASEQTPHKPRFVAGSIGPTKIQLAFNPAEAGVRPVTFMEMVESYAEQVRGLVDGGCDLLLPETSFDTLNIKACLFAIERVLREKGADLPVMVSGTIFEGGRSMAGQTPEAFYTSVSHYPLFSVGLNCALGPKQMRPYVESLAETASCRISCHPNAGLPDGMGGYASSPAEFAGYIREFAESG